MFLTQGWKSGVPRSLRGNISALCLYRNHSRIDRKEIADECSGTLSPEDFEMFFTYATKDSKHDFFYADFDSDEKTAVRKNFNIVLSKKNVDTDYNEEEKEEGRKDTDCV